MKKKTSNLLASQATALNAKRVKAPLLPGEIEKTFRRHLGRHNLHLNLLEIATRSFEEAVRANGDEPGYVRQQAKSFGFHSFHPEAVTLKAAHSNLIASHIAYIASAGDVMCQTVRSSPHIKILKGQNTALFNAINQGDFVRKTVALVVFASTNHEERELAQIEARTRQVSQMPCFALVDYYRLIRNDELHKAGIVDDDSEDAIRLPDMSVIGNAYGFKLKTSKELTAADALVCSKAWQGVATWLCRNMLNEAEQLIPELKRRFGHLAGERRATGSRNFMMQAFLFSKEDAARMLDSLSW
jgi:hypothetical protein